MKTVPSTVVFHQVIIAHMMGLTVMGMPKTQCVPPVRLFMNPNPAMRPAFMKLKKSKLMLQTSSSVITPAMTTATDVGMCVPITSGTVSVAIQHCITTALSTVVCHKEIIVPIMELQREATQEILFVQGKLFINPNPATGPAFMKPKRSRLIHLTSSSVNSLVATTAIDAAMSVPTTTGNVYAGT